MWQIELLAIRSCLRCSIFRLDPSRRRTATKHGFWTTCSTNNLWWLEPCTSTHCFSLFLKCLPANEAFHRLAIAQHHLDWIGRQGLQTSRTRGFVVREDFLHQA